MDPNESPSLLQQTKQTDVHGNFLLITRCGWVLLGNLWMCGWLWFRHAGGRPLHRLAADSAFYSCGYWYRWIFADQLSQNVVNLFVWLIYDIPTKKDQMARNSDELIWIASLPAQCYNSGNAINLLSPVRYMHYWNRTFVALQDPDESSTLYIDHGITQLVIYIVYPMFAIFVAKRIAVNWCADILRPVPVMLYCCNGSTTPPLEHCSTSLFMNDDGWFHFFQERQTITHPCDFWHTNMCNKCAPLAVGCLCALWCFWCYTEKHDLSGSHRIGCTKGRCFGCVFLELKQCFTQHVGLGIVGFRW